MTNAGLHAIINHFCVILIFKTPTDIHPLGCAKPRANDLAS
jgi:hypothetical protein